MSGQDASSSWDVTPITPGVRVTVAESLIRDLGRVSEWCDLLGIKLNASNTKTMIVRRRTMHPQSSPLTIGGTALKECDYLAILGVTFDSKMTFIEASSLCFQSSFSKTVSLGTPGECSMIDRFLGDAFGVLSCPFCSTVLQCGARLLIRNLNCWTVQF